MYNPGKHINTKKMWEVFHHKRGILRVFIKFQNYVNTTELVGLIFLLLPLELMVKLYLDFTLTHGKYKHLGGRHTAKTAESLPVQTAVLSVTLQPPQARRARGEICLESSCQNY